MTLGRRIALLRNGAIEQSGAPLDLYERPVSRFVGAFLGSPGINVLPLTVDADSVNACGLRLMPSQGARSALANGEPVETAFRPENVSLHREAAAGRAAARVIVVEPMGHETLVTLEVSGRRVVARVPAQSSWSPGDAAHLAVAQDHVMFFDGGSGRRV